MSKNEKILEKEVKKGSENGTEIRTQRKKKKLNFKKILKNQQETISLKIVILCFSAGAICIFPFIVLQLQTIGLSINEIAVIYLIIPFGALLGPIVSGMIADKSGKYKLVFLINGIMGSLSINLLMVIPPYERSKIYLNCNEGLMSVDYSECNECISNFNYINSSHVLILKNCKACDGKEKMEINCREKVNETSFCPIFNTSEDIEVTLALEEDESYCERLVQNLSQQNTTNFETQEKCTEKQTCDYECEVPDAVQECFHEPYLSNTFIWSAIVTFAGNFFISSAFTMLDATILQLVKEKNLSIGKQKIMNMIGFAFTPLLAGFLIDVQSKKLGYRSYMPTFVLSDILIVVAGLFTCKLKMTADKNTSNIFKDLGKLFSALEVDLFLLLALILGCNFGFIETYLFIYLQSLGASSFLLGLTMTVGCLSSIPMLFWADWLDKKIGRHIIFLICFTAYAIRMIGYSFIRNPWMCLIFECFESITYQLMWVTCLKLCPLLAPKGLLATMTGLTGSIHYSFGKGIGGFLGGRFINLFGLRISFRIFGGIALCGGIFYLIIHYTYFKRIFEKKEKELAEAERLEKLEENEKMLPNGIDKRPSYNEISMDLNHSFLTAAGPQRKYSVDGAVFGLRRNSKCVNSRKTSKEHSKNDGKSISNMNTLSISVPFLYKADLYDRIGHQECQTVSRSMNNVKI